MHTRVELWSGESSQEDVKIQVSMGRAKVLGKEKGGKDSRRWEQLR